ncbi:activated Cdc42 kinase-like [Nasonia vitripennis]|uniref:non-specific protein-tyrosine kinase n=1 Tax=Nasonia vitripennis TaxID=7425 RepID=A0A7M7M7S7_NASVI|nr:activated Cdc42 kinase-like [Nasonia vitripennis]
MDAQLGMSRNTGPGLYEFLMEAELQQYYAGIRGDLKVQNTAQLKYVTEEDLCGIGMTKPEMRRLKKYFQKHFPQNYLSKFKKMLLPKKEEPMPGSLAMLPEERQDRPPIRVPNKHMIPADAIIVNKELGTGEFGVVQQGVWTNDGERIQVAIKCLSRERMQNNPIEFLKEAAIMHSIDHEHIVRLYGVVLDTNSLMLVTELAPLRSLLECLKEPSLRASFPVPSLCDFSVQIADGMQYLEAKRLIHRDLAARNILVFSKNKVKISDFGLSRALGVGKDYYQTNFNVNLKLPIAWCAPECISYLKFTSASDVWAYGVTLWEMFSYGFQPWAALTGHQILEAIDEPNFQRLEQPDCCPKDYFSLMQQCWQHEPTKRPKFSELICLLPDLKPEQVQAVQDNSEIGQLTYRQGDVITVLDKGSSNTLWKGVLNNGKTGFFNPAHTIAYLGSNLPSNKPGEFTRGDGKNIFSSQRRKIRTDMISSPQGDLKHTGHVGLDGAYFGDISFLGGKYPHLPRQVVTPYKPQEDVADNNSSQMTSQDVMLRGLDRDSNRESIRDSRSIQHVQRDTQSKHESLWSDSCSEISHLGNATNNIPPSMVSSTDSSTVCADHEYHEISDEENQESPRGFEKPLSFDFGPSLLDEMDQMFRSLGSSPPPPPPQGHPVPTEHDSSNARNELREIQAKQSCKKKQATVKPISAADQKTLYSAIAMAQELTARSMTDLEHPQDALGSSSAVGGTGGVGSNASAHSPRTPASPSRRRKFSFKLPHQHSPKPDRRHFSEEAASIPDIQWLCSSLQSLSSTVSSIESLGAPSTLKLPLWDKASAEFCFAKSRELLTKPTAWTSYVDVEFDARILDNASATRQNLVKSSEFLENGNSHRKSIASCLEFEAKQQHHHHQNGKGNFEFPKESKRVSTSYVDRYFEQPKYVDEEAGIDCPLDSDELSYEDEQKINELEQSCRNAFLANFPEFGIMLSEKNNRAAAAAATTQTNRMSESSNNKPPPLKFDLPKLEAVDKRPAPFSPRHHESLQKSSAYSGGSSDSMKTTVPDSPRGNLEAVRINIQSFRKYNEQTNGHQSNGHGHDYPYAISNNPLFMEPEKRDSPAYSSSESLRVNVQRLRRKSDAELNHNQQQLNSKLLAEKYQREVSGLESVKNYLDSKKGLQSGLNLGFGKLTQNMIQLGKNIAQNTRNLGGPAQQQPPPQKPKHLDLNIPKQSNGSSGSPTMHQRILEPPKPYQNERKVAGIAKTEIFVEKIQSNASVFRPRTSSLSENRRPHMKNLRRSFHPDTNDSSEDSDSVSHSETDIRSRLRFKRRHKRMPHNLRLNFKNQKAMAAAAAAAHHHQAFLHPNSARGFSTLELSSGKSPPPSTSFLNSLSPPFSSRNNVISWPESAPSSSITFTSNSDLDSDTSSEYPEFSSDATLSEEAKEVYNSLVETPIAGANGNAVPEPAETNPLRMLRSGLPIVRPRIRGNKHATIITTVETSLSQGGSRSFHLDGLHHSSGARTLPKLRIPAPSQAPPPIPSQHQQSLTLNRHHHSMEIENNQNQGNVGGIDENPIPLPPRDRSKTLQPKSSLPRHQRKHPLIIPGGGVTRTLAKMQAVSSPTIEDQVDGMHRFSAFAEEPEDRAAADGASGVETRSAGTERPVSRSDVASPELTTNSPEEFERRIDSELAALDSLPSDHHDSKSQQRCSVISEDLLEFSENLIDCDAEADDSDEDNDTVTDSPCLDSPQTATSTQPVIEQATRKIVVEASEAAEASRNSTPTSLNSNSSVYNRLKQQQSDQQQQTQNEKGETMTRTSDHVSCEDLLEFACDGPNSRRTRGPRNGEQSDEVRIMLKVLHEQSTPESCVAALNVTNWDVLAAIKLERLQGLLKKENNFVGLEDCKVMLNQCGGDVVKAAALLRNTEDTAAV